MVLELHLQWDLVFLEQYVTENMVPQSLRWDIYPQQGETHLESWYSYFNEAGTKLISFLITRKQNHLSKLDGEIKELKDGLLRYKNSVEYYFLSSNLQAHLIKEDRDQKTKKHKKYTQDIGDYRSGNVFSWQKPSISDPAMETNNGGTIALSPSTQLPSQPNPSMSRSQPSGETSQPQRGRPQNAHTPRNTQRGRGHNSNREGGRRGNNPHLDNYDY